MISALEFTFEMVDLGDQFLEALPDVLTFLVRLEKLPLEAPNALGVFVSLLTKFRRLSARIGECVCEGRNGTL